MVLFRIYLDTSVFGGYFDEEFKQSTLPIFEAIDDGYAIALISETLVAEIADAPEHVQNLLEHVLHEKCEHLELTEDVESLCNAYLSEQIVTEKWRDDALHVAHASIAVADVIVSWNFKHLVNPVRVRGFNSVNAKKGYGPIIIMTPEDIFRSWKEDGYES